MILEKKRLDLLGSEKLKNIFEKIKEIDKRERIFNIGKIFIKNFRMTECVQLSPYNGYM